MTRVIHNVDVSVVIAAWNSADFIKTAIFSALNQVDINVEVIVVDDLSTDNTISVVEAINDTRITLIKNKSNTGPGGARNLGFDAANGTWIAVLDSDDEMLPDRLSKLLSLKGEATDIILDNFYVRNNKGDILTPYYSKNELPLGPFSLQYLINTNLIFSKVKSTGYLKPLFKSSFVKKHSIRYWPEVRVGEDYYFLASCLAKSATTEVVPYIGYIYNVRGGSISSVLSLQHIQTLLSSDGKFNQMYNLDTFSIDAQVTRNKNLLRAYKYLEIVGLLKDRKLLKALIYSILFPKSSFLLHLPILKRLNLFRRGYNG
ncbi:glycosyltransferase family 2 protein [Shewanella vesiculosa]|uniref:glycosyltransferase family 2 protein n=1 Tax=Shewanella vesiculosa TaxID=518738 RepID=UPI000F5072DE|nr:glycosyltransferase family 2 protein [Shewanella vesiculosa]RPA55069.1 glycosyltransferase family 2 protein [Shewanella vesiculosa]UJL44065.1 glycosyltransferase family 2 protein [Shewanella vesiculosa]